jgi:hypothetical protein
MIGNNEQSQVNQILVHPGFEYRSKLELFGWPLVHITKGYDPQTGKRQVSKGILAIGEIAIGGIAIGGLAIGGIAVGGMGVGVIALGGLAIGVIAAGGFAMGALAAVGAVAYSLVYAVGVLAHAPYVISHFRVDHEFLGFLERSWSRIQQILL